MGNCNRNGWNTQIVQILREISDGIVLKEFFSRLPKHVEPTH